MTPAATLRRAADRQAIVFRPCGISKSGRTKYTGTTLPRFRKRQTAGNNRKRRSLPLSKCPAVSRSRPGWLHEASISPHCYTPAGLDEAPKEKKGVNKNKN